MLCLVINYIGFMMESLVLELLQQRLLVPGRVELHDFQWVQSVDLVDVLLQLVARLRLDFLDFLEAALLDEALLGCGVVGKGLGELVQNVVEDLSGTIFDEGFQGAQVGAHLEDALQGLLCLLFQVFRTGGVAVKIQQ